MLPPPPPPSLQPELGDNHAALFDWYSRDRRHRRHDASLDFGRGADAARVHLTLPVERLCRRVRLLHSQPALGPLCAAHRPTDGSGRCAAGLVGGKEPRVGGDARTDRNDSGHGGHRHVLSHLFLGRAPCHHLHRALDMRVFQCHRPCLEARARWAGCLVAAGETF